MKQKHFFVFHILNLNYFKNEKLLLLSMYIKVNLATS